MRSLIVFVLVAKCVLCVQYPTIRVIRNSSEYTEPAVLPCWEADSREHVLLWITHQDKLISWLDHTDVGEKYFITSDGALTVLNGVADDSGTYKCIKNDSMGLSVMETKLEVIDTSFIPEIDDIEGNIIRSVVAGACTAIFFLASCGIYHFRWIPASSSGEPIRSQRMSTSSSSSSSSASSTATPMSKKGSAHDGRVMDTVMTTEDEKGSRKGSCSLQDNKVTAQEEAPVQRSRNGSTGSAGIDNQALAIGENE